jgi:subfamily B ATP-binding cassette protein MsbA
LQNADLALFKQQTASALGNTLVFEVQNGAQLMVSSVMSLVRDSLTLLALVAYLLYLNWQLSLIVALLFPAVAWLMKALSKRLYQITRDTQTATDELAYVVEETSLAYREIRLHHAQSMQISRFEILAKTLQRLAMKTSIASSSMTPMTQILSAIALSGVISVALMQSQQTGMTVGGFAAFVTAMLMLIAPIKHLSEITGPLTRGLAALERGFELIENTPPETGGSYQSARARGHIVLEDISVKYQPDMPWALHHINLNIQPGETVALLGSNGAGKTTLNGVLSGLIKARAGHVNFDGQDTTDWNARKVVQAGLIHVPEGRKVFPNLNVLENLSLGAFTRGKERREENLEKIFGIFPRLRERISQLAGTLSGGEQQMLAIGRGLMAEPKLLILDEPSLGLSPLLVEEMFTLIGQLKSSGLAVLLVEQNVGQSLEIADRAYVMENGLIRFTGKPAELLASDTLRQAYLGM